VACAPAVRGMKNALTIDVEEYFHPAEVQAGLGDRAWTSLPYRVEAQVDRIMELLDQHDVTATFFVLGWVAEHQPKVVRSIAAAGHELACHSYAHRLVYKMTPDEFRADTRRAVAAIEDASGVRPVAYRAPSYSITSTSLWALDTLVECGFRYDSSVYPISHDRYGIPGFSRHACVLETGKGPIMEIPPATVQVGRDGVAPIGGGGYLRLLPYRYTAAGIRRVNKTEGTPVCIYFHPWEIDPDQPKLATGMVSRLRTYTGLRTMIAKLEWLLSEFEFSTLTDVYRCPEPTPTRVQLARAVAVT
jgi:polysaccharide deacetylase family protein (PEP-CTERM system associated)